MCISQNIHPEIEGISMKCTGVVLFLFITLVRIISQIITCIIIEVIWQFPILCNCSQLVKQGVSIEVPILRIHMQVPD